MSKKDYILGFTAIIYAITLLFTLINSYFSYNVDSWRFFYNFTQQSNILLLVWLILFSLSIFKYKGLNNLVRNRTLLIAISVYLSITYFIVALILQPIFTGSFNPVSDGSELWLHHLSPIFMWFYLFFVEGTGEIKPRKSLYVLIYPLLYVFINLIIGSTTTFSDGTPAYNYGFINPNNYVNIFVFIGVILGLLLVFSLFTVLLTKFKNHVDNTFHK